MSRHFIPISSSPDWAAGVIAKRKMALDGMERRGIGDARYHAGREQVFVDGGGGLFHMAIFCKDWNVRYASIIRLRNSDGTTKAYKAIWNGEPKSVFRDNDYEQVFQTQYGQVCGWRVNGIKSDKTLHLFNNKTALDAIDCRTPAVCNFSISGSEIANIFIDIKEAKATITASINNVPAKINGKDDFVVNNIFLDLVYDHQPPYMAVGGFGCQYNGTEMCLTLKHSYVDIKPDSWFAGGTYEYSKELFQTYKCVIERDDDVGVNISITKASECGIYESAVIDPNDFFSTTRTKNIQKNGIKRLGSGYNKYGDTIATLEMDIDVTLNQTDTRTIYNYSRNNDIIDVLVPAPPLSYSKETIVTETGTAYFDGIELYTQKREVSSTLNHTSNPGYSYAKYIDGYGNESSIDLSGLFSCINYNMVEKEKLTPVLQEYNGMYPMSFSPYRDVYSFIDYPEIYNLTHNYKTIESYYCSDIKSYPADVYLVAESLHSSNDRFSVGVTSRHNNVFPALGTYVGTLYGLFADPGQTESSEVIEDYGNPWLSKVWDITSASYERRYFPSNTTDFVCDGSVVDLDGTSVQACVSNIRESLTCVCFYDWGEAHEDGVYERVLVKEWGGDFFEVDLSILKANTETGMWGIDGIIPGWNN